MDSNIYHRKGPGTGSQAATGETISRLQDGEFETFGMKGLRSKEQTPTEDKNKLQARGFKASNVEVSSTKLMVASLSEERNKESNCLDDRPWSLPQHDLVEQMRQAAQECAWDRQIDERKKLSRSIWGGSVEGRDAAKQGSYSHQPTWKTEWEEVEHQSGKYDRCISNLIDGRGAPEGNLREIMSDSIEAGVPSGPVSNRTARLKVSTQVHQ